MKKDIQDALLSVGEVAVFAWSLLELLLTRILPLAGILAGHLLLQFCRLLVSAVFRGRIEPQAEYSYDVHAEELIKEDIINVQVDGDTQNDIESLKSTNNKLEDGDHQNDLGSLKSSNKLEEGQEISREESLTVPSLTHDEDAELQQAAAMPAAATELVDEHVHLAELAPSDEQMIDLHTSDAATNEVQVRVSDMADLGAANVVVDEQKHVSAKGEDNGDRIDLEPSDVQASEEAKSSTVEGELRKSRRMMRVLPPSLSQIKRTLMQRSRRGASGSTPSPDPLKKKKLNISPRTRKVSSSAIKSSPSYDNFMGKFRKHFLLDRA